MRKQAPTDGAPTDGAYIDYIDHIISNKTYKVTLETQQIMFKNKLHLKNHVFCLFSEKSAQNRLIPLVLLEILI